jgi:serine/threonine protein kinase
MSPEQLLGDPVDARSDIYSLGCILYQMLTGRRSFDEPTREQMIKRRLTEKAPHPKDLVSDLPKTLDLIVARMLNRTPHDRYATAAEVRDLLIPAIALEGGFDDPSWRPQTRSNPTVFIQAAEQPTQEMTPYPGIAVHAPIWRRRNVVTAAAIGVGVVATIAMALSAMNAREQRRNANLLAQAAATKPAPVSVITIQTPRPAALPPTRGSSTAARTGDSTLPVATSRPASADVSPELRQPIEELRVAIESGLPTKIEEVYKAYDHDDSTKKFFKTFIDKVDSIHIKAISYRSWNITGNMAELRYRMNIAFWANGAKVPTSENITTWRADLVRDGQKAPWKIRHLTQSRL